jgi:hypothetical protein
MNDTQQCFRWMRVCTISSPASPIVDVLLSVLENDNIVR